MNTESLSKGNVLTVGQNQPGKAKGRSVSLLWGQSIGAKALRVPSFCRLSRCLPTAIHAIEDYVKLFAELGLNLRTLKDRQNLPIEEEALLPRIDEFAAIVKSLASVYGTIIVR